MFELSLSRNTFSLCVICLAVTGDLVVFCAVVLLYDGRVTVTPHVYYGKKQ